MGATRSRSERRLGSNLILALAAFVLALAVGEAALRLLEAMTPGDDLRRLHRVRRDRPWLYELRPGAHLRAQNGGGVDYRINGDGFRDRDRPRPKPEHVFRIVVLGDSVTFGYGVREEYAFPSRLEALLARRSPTVEVLNLGVPGYNPYNQAALFAGRGGSFEPDLVLVQFCINDLNVPTLHFDAQTQAALGPLPDAAFPDPSRQHSVAAPPPHWCIALRTCALGAGLLGRSRPRADARALREAMAPASALPPGPERRWIETHYGELARGAARLGAAFAVVVFPYSQQLEDGHQSHIQRDLTTIGAQAGWKTLDLLPAFLRAARSGAGPLFLDLWHPNATGHRIAAESLLAQLDRAGLLPPALMDQ